MGKRGAPGAQGGRVAAAARPRLQGRAGRHATRRTRPCARARRFGAKLVRGAYMNLERRRAAARGYESPIWDTLQDTHDNYNR